MIRPLRSPLAWLAGLLLCVACASTSSGAWIEREVGTGNESLLVTTIQHALHERGYQVTSGLDTGRRRIETRWKEERTPFHGWRWRAIVEWEPLEGARFRVRVRVENEENKSEFPLERAHDKWRSLPDQPAKATSVVVTLQMRMQDYEIEVGDPESLDLDPFEGR